MPKKLCKLGLECPHMHQAQHMSEFRHEDEKAKAAMKRTEDVWKSKGNTLAGGSRSSGASGSARRGRGVSRLLDSQPAPQPKRSKVEKRGEKSQSKDFVGGEIIEILSDDSDGDSDSDGDVVVIEPTKSAGVNGGREVVDLCSPTYDEKKTKKSRPRPVPTRPRPPPSPASLLDQYNGSEEKQMQSAISQSNNVLKEDQDSEYYESLIKDKEKVQQKREEELQREEEKLIEKAVQESAKSLEQESTDRLEALKSLLQHKLPSPDSEDANDDTIVTLLIKLPRSFASTSVTRKFYKKNTAQDVLEFVRTDVEVQEKNKELHLCTVFPVRRIGDEEQIEGLGLGKRGTVVVREP